MIKKTLFTLAVFLLTIGSVKAATNLYEYYAENGQKLPPVSERVSLAIGCGISNYSGTYEQNTALLDCLQGGESLGATIPTVVAVYSDNLQDKITSSATTMTLVRGTDKVGTSLSGTYGFVIDEGTSIEEFVICTASGTALTACQRGISVVDGKTEVTALKQAHRKGASIKITNFPQLAIISRILNGQETLPNLLTYDNSLLLGIGTATNTLATKYYVDNTASAGASDSDLSTKGLVETPTRAEVASGTKFGGTGAYLFLPSFYATTTPSATTSIPVTKTNGKLDQSFLDLTENYTWTGSQTFNATTTFTGNVSGVVTFFGDGSDGNVTLTTGTTTLTRDMFYNNLTIPGDAELKTNGFRVYVKNTLSTSTATSGSGLITANGGAGSNGVYPTGGNAGTRSYTRGTLPVPPAPGAGGNGGIIGGAGPVAGTAGDASSYGLLDLAGADGGAGGAGEAGGAGGATGTIISLGKNIFESYIYNNNNSIAFYGVSSSAGGGGGGSGGGAYGGGGGGGGGANGGVIWLSAKTINGITIQAKGGNGGNGGNQNGSNGGGGGGGGGGNGGVIILFYTTSNNIITTVTAGIGGSAGSGDAGVPVAGGNGQVGYVFNNDL